MALPRGNPCLSLRDALGLVFADQPCAVLFPSHGQPADAPSRLALVSLPQHAGNVSERLAADAARGRVDWKDVLGLELTDPGFTSPSSANSAAA